MWKSIQPAPPDSILGLTEEFKKDQNPQKVNLGVGVYKDEAGNTPVLRCVKAAEKILLEQQTIHHQTFQKLMSLFCRHIEKQKT